VLGVADITSRKRVYLELTVKELKMRENIFSVVSPKPCGLLYEQTRTAHTLGSRVRIPLGSFNSSHVFECFYVKEDTMLWSYPSSKKSYR
jgi:hypothetical protein